LASMTTTESFELAVSIPYAITPIEPTQVQVFVTQSGMQLLQPVLTDQCWNAYPLCTPEPAANLRYVDQDLPSGLRR
jgi:hypothetical protein